MFVLFPTIRGETVGLEDAIELSKQGRLSEAEDIFLDEIEAGNVQAQLSLAYAFQDASLNSLALTNFLELKGTSLWEFAAPQVSSIFLTVHKYREARESVKGLSSQARKGPIDAIAAVEEHSKSYAGDIPGLVEHWLSEEDRLLELLAQDAQAEIQIELVQVREFLAHYSTVLNSGLMTSISVQTIGVNVGGAEVPQMLQQAVGLPARRWFEAAHAAVCAFTLLYHQRHPLELEEFNALALRAQSFIEKKYVLSERELTEEDEDFVINNLTWALETMDLPSQDFYFDLMP